MSVSSAAQVGSVIELRKNGCGLGQAIGRVGQEEFWINL